MAKKKKDIVWPVLEDGLSLLDTHCHLEMVPFKKDLNALLQHASDRGVTKTITIGIDVPSSKKAIDIAEKNQNIFSTVGVHPHNVTDVTDSTYEEIRILAAHEKVVGYGEIGMDLVKGYAPVALQEEHFVRQVALAKELELPVIVHDREAHETVMNILKKHAPFNAGGVMHCFSGDMKLAEEVLNLGFYISVPGIVTFNTAKDLQDVAKNIPLSRLILETDGPFLAPAPFRGKRNEPAFVLFTAQKVAELRGLSINDIAKATTENAESLFGIG